MIFPVTWPCSRKELSTVAIEICGRTFRPRSCKTMKLEFESTAFGIEIGLGVVASAFVQPDVVAVRPWKQS